MKPKSSAVFISHKGQWLQLTEAVSSDEAREWLGHYEKWFPSERFKACQL
jgi:hypothetical protein